MTEEEIKDFFKSNRKEFVHDIRFLGFKIDSMKIERQDLSGENVDNASKIAHTLLSTYSESRKMDVKVATFIICNNLVNTAYLTYGHNIKYNGLILPLLLLVPTIFFSYSYMKQKNAMFGAMFKLTEFFKKTDE